MGIVYAVRDRELDRDVALKILRPERSAGRPDVTPSAPLTLEPSDAERSPSSFDRRVERFLREARLTASMNHPGIAPVFEAGHTPGGLPYYTMRLIEGGRTLADAIESRRGRPFDARAELLETFARVCDAVAYAHSRGIVHRDVKPSNVALGEFGEVVVIDWGLGRSMREAAPSDEAARPTQPPPAGEPSSASPTNAIAVGTPGYMAPEALAGDPSSLDARADVYSLGASLFEILTGRLPLMASTLEAYRQATVAGPAPRATDADPAVPSALASLCARALERDRERRTIDVAGIADGVRSWLRSSALAREVDSRLGDARSALEGLDGLEADVLERRVERAADALQAARALARDAGSDVAATIARAREMLTAARIRAARARWLRRTGWTALATVTVAAVVVGALLDARRRDAEAARATAETERASAIASRGRAEGLLDFLVTDIADEVEPVGHLSVLEHVGTRARAYHASLAPADETPTSLANRATALRRLGEVHELRGDLPAARSAYEEARAAAARRLAAIPGDLDARSAVSLIDARLGRLALARGRPRQAAAALRAHLKDVERALASRPHDASLLDARADALATVGRIDVAEGDWPAARTALDDSVASARAAVDAAPGAGRSLVHLAQRCLDRASVHGTIGAKESSSASAEEATTIAARELTRSPDDVRWVRLDADAKCARSDASPVADAAALEAAVKAYRFLVARDPENRSDAVRLAQALRRVGDARIAARDLAGSRTPFAEAYAIVDRLHGLDEAHGIWAHLVITACDRVVASRRGTPDATNDDSVALRRRALDIAERLATLDPDDLRWRHLVVYTSFALGLLELDRGDADGDRRVEEAVRTAIGVSDVNPSDTEIAHLLAMAARRALSTASARARPKEFAALCDEAVARVARTAATRADDAMPAAQCLALRVALAEFLVANGEREHARDVARRAIDAARSIHDADLASGIEDSIRRAEVVLKEGR